MDAGLDSGPIVAQRTVPLRGDMTAPELEAELAGEAADLLTSTLEPWLAGVIEPAAQPAEGVTMTRPLRRVDGALDARRAATHLERQVRAYQPWPGSFVETDAGRLIVWRARVADDGGPPGTIVAGAHGVPALATANGLLELLEVQPAGSRRMGGAELVRGRPGLVGSQVRPPANASDDG
jgi:methionyl-tRNA formyltransferase